MMIVVSSNATSTNLGYFKSLDLIRKVIEIVKSDYVDENIDEQELIYGAVEGILRKLDDPYTRFMDPKTFKEMQTETQGEFGGLGIVISVQNRMLTVVSPIDGTPAARAGVMAGDMIIEIDGEDVIDIALHEAVQLLRGPVGTNVTITVVREGAKDSVEYELTREIIKVPSVKYWTLEDNSIGYIRLTQFIQTSAQDLERAMIALQEAEVKSIVLDLRNNPGGLLTSAVEVGRKFVPKGDIVSIKGRDGEENTYSSFFQYHPTIPLIVLINGGSASASEIVAGAIRDNGRGILVGENTFGKGSVQTVISLNDGSAMALTTALYFTPDGTNIHEDGITPHIEVKMPTLSQKQQDDMRKAIEKDQKFLRKLSNAGENGELKKGIIIIRKENEPDLKHELSGFVDTPDSFERDEIQQFVVNPHDMQLQRAIDILRSAEVFVPLMQK